MLNLLIKTGFPFAAFRFPGEREFINIVQTEKDPVTFDPREADRISGFIFAPFDREGHNPFFLIRHDLSYTWNPGNPVNAPVSFPLSVNGVLPVHIPEIKKDEYVRQILEIRQYIKQGQARKVVLSRPQTVKLPEVFDFTLFFTTLHKSYPDVFLFFVFLPGYGIWVGATPELFMEHNGRYIKTVSLAGTLPAEGPEDITFWPEKEKEEQQIVTKYILETLRSKGFFPADIQGPHTIYTGKMAHLQTVFHIDIPGGRKKLNDLIDALHPTPAICGYPKKAALDIIHKTENYDRQYYTGYLGPWNTRYPSQLYINLRSMQFMPKGKEAVLYAGGGITAASDPEKEWDETVMKIQTLLSVLEKMPNFTQ